MSAAATAGRPAAITCPGCARDNDPRRRYCGGCGCNLEPVCRGCGFGNDSVDRFCGGCGQHLFAASTSGAPASSPVPPSPPITSPIEAMLASKQAAEQARKATEAMNAQSGIVPSGPAPGAAAPPAPAATAKPSKPAATLHKPSKATAPPTPTPTPTPAPSPAGLARGSVPGLKAVGANSLSDREFADLMTTVNAKPPPTNLPEGAITQDDLDRLFGGGS